jgi:hypothetical protein
MRVVSMKTKFTIILWLAFLISCATMKPDPYKETVAQWTSYKDVANWMSKNLRYDTSRSRTKGWQPQTPEQTFRSGLGICQDGANFARDALNRINPDYHARIVYINNKLGPPHHWVTAFTMDGKLYIMDYTTGPAWASMKGLHGPYDSLTEYEKFLSSLTIKNFVVGYVEYY